MIISYYRSYDPIQKFNRFIYSSYVRRSSGTKRLSPIARLIEEILLLTPWNLTKECLEVTNVSLKKESGDNPMSQICPMSQFCPMSQNLSHVPIRNKGDSSASMELETHQVVVVKALV